MAAAVAAMAWRGGINRESLFAFECLAERLCVRAQEDSPCDNVGVSMLCAYGNNIQHHIG